VKRLDALAGIGLRPSELFFGSYGDKPTAAQRMGEHARAGIFELYRRNAEAAEQRDKPQPTQTAWAIGSMEWQAEQKKSR